MPFVGIYTMGFVSLVAGLGTFGTAVAYAVKPTERKLALMRPLSLASIFAAICSFSGGVATVLSGVSATTSLTAATAGPILLGLRQAVLPLFVAFGFLAVSWLLVAVGFRRPEV